MRDLRFSKAGYFRETMSEEAIYEKISASDVWREALAIIRRYPLATITPAAVLGTVAEAPYYFIDDSGVSFVPGRSAVSYTSGE